MESKRSCCSPVTCCGMPIQKGCYIFSIINAVLCSLIMLGSLGFLALVLPSWLEEEARSENEMLLLRLITSIPIAYCVGSLTGLVFAVILCVGVKSNKPRYIMAYLVYGISTTVLIVAGVVAFVCMAWGESGVIVYALISLGFCVIYSALLLLVYQTHAVLSARTIAGHERWLANDCWNAYPRSGPSIFRHSEYYFCQGMYATYGKSYPSVRLQFDLF